MHRCRSYKGMNDRGIVAGACLSAKGLRIPRLGLGDLRFRKREVYVVIPDRHGLGLIFQDFDAHACDAQKPRQDHAALLPCNLELWRITTALAWFHGYLSSGRNQAVARNGYK